MMQTPSINEYPKRTHTHTYHEGEWVETIYGRGKITYIRDQTGGKVYETTIGEFTIDELQPLGDL